jgi:hypothetical protein
MIRPEHLTFGKKSKKKKKEETATHLEALWTTIII